MIRPPTEGVGLRSSLLTEFTTSRLLGPPYYSFVFVMLNSSACNGLCWFSRGVTTPDIRTSKISDLDSEAHFGTVWVWIIPCLS